ncbi:MAG: glycosyl transferase group 1 [Fibrobacteres bacterium]|nr:glycosyl transferase group 1 [Fibrobacterota bacterium]
MRHPHVTHLVLGLPLGGTERLVERMLRTPPPSFRASCVCLDLIGRLGDSLQADGVSVTLIDRKPGFDWSLPFRIARYASKNGVDILHCHQYTPWFYGALARLFRPSLRILFTEHGRFYPDIPSRKRRFVNRILVRLTDRVSAVSPSVKDALVEVEAFPPGKIQVVFNGIEPPAAGNADRGSLRARFSLKADWTYFILCARFDPIKWIPGLLEALRIVVDASPASGLILVGEGPEAEAIREKIRGLGLADHVVLPGFQENVVEWLRAADVFVLSSLSEGTSVSLLESMAVGMPSVATRVGGNPAVIEDGRTGLLVPTRDAVALGAAMLRLARDPGARDALGREAAVRFNGMFRFSRMMETYNAIYMELKDGKATAR